MPRKAKDRQAIAAPPTIEVPQVSFDLVTQDAFVASHAVEFVHFKAVTSPIGLKDKGDYRRSDSYDDVSVNGQIYKKGGCLSAVMLNNSSSKSDMDGGLMSESTVRVTFPRFYNEDADGEESTGKRIYLAPGDRLYVKKQDVDTKVVRDQLMQFEPSRDNVAMYPICCVEHLIDSRNIEYKPNVDFKVTAEGNIRWLARNPGIDPDTGKGRVYSIRYLYEAHWYIMSLPNEVRIGRTTVAGDRVETRFPYQAILVREYIYHSRKNSDKTEQKQEFDKEPSREVKQEEPLYKKKPFVKVQMSDVDDSEEQS